MELITQASASKLKVFETCEFQAYLKFAKRIPEPERPLPPGKTEHANDRGTRIHTAAELYTKGEMQELIPELNSFRPEFESLRTLYSRGMVSLEGEWAINRAWEPVPWGAKEVWHRLKLDALVHLSEEEAVVIDVKSGKKFGNEISHADQVQQYQLLTFLRYPKLEVIHTELWYPDINELTPNTFTRRQGLRFKPSLERRLNAMTTAITFNPKPNIFNCKYCPYGSWGTGHCEKGVRR